MYSLFRHLFHRSSPTRGMALGLIVFTVAFFVLLYVQASAVFPDPDSFYHAKMAILIRDQGIPRTFPWLSDFTTLGSHFADQHFLYHVLLIPFESAFPPLIGIKIVTVLLAAGAVTAVYGFLRSFGVRLAWLWALLLLAVNPFIFRMGLAKAPSLSIIFLIVGLWLILRHRVWWAACWAFLYVWFYGAYPLLLLAAGLYVAVCGMAWFLQRKKGFFRVFVRTDSSVRVFGAVLLGIVAGMVINPFFPNNLFYEWEQVYEIGLKNYRDIIGVGGEWYPTEVTSFIGGNILVLLMMLLGCVTALFRRRWTLRDTVLLLLAVLFGALTLKSRRYVEYFVPFGMLFGASAFASAMEKLRLWQLVRRWAALPSWRVIGVGALVMYFAVVLPLLVARDIRRSKEELGNGLSATHLARASDWIHDHTPAGSIVVHSSWDEFPVLLYHNDHNHYISGLDPTFMYLNNPDTYWAYVNLTLGKNDDPASIVRDILHSSTVLIVGDHTAMEREIKRDDHFVESYRDDEAVIYTLQNERTHIN